MRIATFQLDPIVGDLKGNTQKILNSIAIAKKNHADIAVFPELTICGYPPEDLVLFPSFIEKIEMHLQKIIKASEDLMVIVGLVRNNPKKVGKHLLNSAAVICNQKLLGFKDKTLLPTYDIFNERRYFEPGEEQEVWEYKNKRIGVLICEDAWQHAKELSHIRYKRDPVEELKKLHPDVVINMSASPYYYQKKCIRASVFGACAKTLQCPLVVVNQVGGNDELVFDGYSMCLNSHGDVIKIAKGFCEDFYIFDTQEKQETLPCSNEPIKDLYQALVLGVKDYFLKLGLKKACLGLSGGVDSAVTACIAIDALGAKNVLAISMPSRYSSLSSMTDAEDFSARLNIELKVIPIDHVFQEYLDLLSPVFYGKEPNVAEENLQARIRGMILMGISNKLGHVVLSTGNKSEMAVGYTTLYGDMAGGLGVLVDVSKTLVYELARFINKEKEIIPHSIITKPPSAELKPDQTDQDSLPSYDIVDLVLKEYVEEHLSIEEIVKRHHLDEGVVIDLVKRIHRAEYKRRQGAPGIRVTKRSFTKGRFFPIVQGWVL